MPDLCYSAKCELSAARYIVSCLELISIMTALRCLSEMQRLSESVSLSSTVYLCTSCLTLSSLFRIRVLVSREEEGEGGGEDVVGNREGQGMMCVSECVCVCSAAGWQTHIKVPSP